VKGAAAEKGMAVDAYMRHDLRCKDGKMRATSTAASQQGMPKGELSKRCLFWAMGSRSTSSLIKWIKNWGKNGRAKPVYEKGKPRRGVLGLCVIDDLDWATTIFTAKRLCLDSEVVACMNGSDDFLTLADKTAERKRKAVVWDTVVSKDPQKTVLWECKRRNHLERQPHVRNDLVHQLMANSCTSSEGLAESTGNGFAVLTRQEFIKRRSNLVSQQVRFLVFFIYLPPSAFSFTHPFLLTVDHQKKQCAHSKICRENNFNLPRGTKTLWIHSDEKWFKALVPRTNAKECAELGIERDLFSVHHKYHIQQASNAATTTRTAAACFTVWCYPPPLPPTKFLRFFISQVMVHAAVGFAFDGAPENGGHGLKISLDHACCARVALKDQRKATRHADGSLHCDGGLIRRKGDVCFVDANVTGSNQGTSTNPKCALKDLWEHKLFPRIDALVGPGGPHEGCHVD
jgi:hypothetical protein